MEYYPQDFVRRFGGKVNDAKSCNIPSPGHPPGDLGLHITCVDNGKGYIFYCFNGPSFEECARYIETGMGIETSPLPYIPTSRPARKPTESQLAGAEEIERKAKALAIWNEAGGPKNTPVEWYLQSRGLRLPEGESLRWHRDCPFGTSRVGCMVALVRNVITNEPQAIHRTVISPRGEKISINGCDRKALGPLKNGAVKLIDDWDVTTVLAVAEGIESALSMRLLVNMERLSVWSLISANGLASLPVLPGIEALHIGTDHDAAGKQATRDCGKRWHAAGKEVFRILPPQPGKDVNDLIRAQVAI